MWHKCHWPFLLKHHGGCTAPHWSFSQGFMLSICGIERVRRVKTFGHILNIETCWNFPLKNSKHVMNFVPYTDIDLWSYEWNLNHTSEILEPLIYSPAVHPSYYHWFCTIDFGTPWMLNTDSVSMLQSRWIQRCVQINRKATDNE